MKEAPCTPRAEKDMKTRTKYYHWRFLFVCGQQNSAAFCVENKIVPTCNKLIPITREEIQSPWGREAVLKEHMAHHWNEMAKTSSSELLSAGI